LIGIKRASDTAATFLLRIIEQPKTLIQRGINVFGCSTRIRRPLLAVGG
jgi:hypothetical protein